MLIDIHKKRIDLKTQENVTMLIDVPKPGREIEIVFKKLPIMEEKI